MKFKEYYITYNNGKSNCVVRSLCKILNRKYDEIYNDLLNISNELNCSFNDVEVFESYMKENNIIKIDCEEGIQIKNLNLANGSYIIFCYDKKEYYHMIPIIDNVIYDRNNECMDLYVITIYEMRE